MYLSSFVSASFRIIVTSDLNKLCRKIEVLLRIEEFSDDGLPE